MSTLNQAQFAAVKERFHRDLATMIDAKHKDIWSPVVCQLLGEFVQYTALGQGAEVRRSTDRAYACAVAQMLINSNSREDTIAVGYIHDVWNEIDHAVGLIQDHTRRFM